MERRNEVAVVTRGARGIGRATARLLAQRGAAVCVNYAVHADAAEAVVAEIASAGGRAIAVGADVASPAIAPSMAANCSPRQYATESALREVVWELALELGKVTGDHSDVETPQDRLLGLAIKQELERRLDATLWRVRACRQSLASVSRHRHMMASLAVSHADNDLEFEWIAFASSLDLDHSLPSS